MAGPASAHWRRPNYQGNAWVVSGSVNNPIFRIHCLTGSPDAPALLATGLPQLGQNFELEVSRGTPFLLAYLVYSFHNTQWVGLPLPVNLGIFGAPDCFNYTASDFMTLIILDAAGSGTSPPLTIPNDPNLAGVRWYYQAAALTPGVNALDLLVTNAGTVILGT